MQLVTWRSANGVRSETTCWGAVRGGQVVRLGDSSASLGPASLLAYVQQGPARRTWNDSSLHGEAAGRSIPLAEVQVLAPIPRPVKNLFAVGQNYADHVREVTQPT